MDPEIVNNISEGLETLLKWVAEIYKYYKYQPTGLLIRFKKTPTIIADCLTHMGY